MLLTRCLAGDHGPDAVQVNCLCPGLIGIELADWIRHDEEALARWSSTVPAGRMGTAAQIAGRAPVPACGQPGYPRGAALIADGGGPA